MRECDYNPIIKSDYPDPDVIRVDDTYYMLSTTMHFFPGGALLRSYDLVNWEPVGHLFNELDNTQEERLEHEFTNYGRGMWAPCLRYHNKTFYAVFVSHGTKKTYLFKATDIKGPWKKSEIKGYYHDCSLLFDDDGRNYIVSGNREIRLVELDKDLTGPLEGGLDRVIAVDSVDGLGYEGSHFYKINGRYYLFLIHWEKPGVGRRSEVCLSADSLDGEFTGGEVLNDDMGFFNMGVAQGGIVDTPAGKWYAILFRDNGAVGRIPVIVPVNWKDGFPVFGVGGKVPRNMEIASSRPYYRYEPVYTSDSFKYDESLGEHPALKVQWQWNHKPSEEFWSILPEGGLKIKTGKLSINVTHACNTLTQRMMYPRCEAEVTVDASALKDGDVAGICALQGLYGLVGITKETGEYFLVKIIRSENDCRDNGNDYMPGTVTEKIKLSGPVVSLCLKAVFEDMQDKLDFFYMKDRRWVKVGPSHNLKFRLDHFCGARFGLFVYATKECGGSAVFTDFEYRYNT